MSRFLGIFCRHEWEEVARATIMRNVYRASKPEEILRVLNTGDAIELRCKLCGDHKLRRLSA